MKHTLIALFVFTIVSSSFASDTDAAIKRFLPACDRRLLQEDNLNRTIQISFNGEKYTVNPLDYYVLHNDSKQVALLLSHGARSHNPANLFNLFLKANPSTFDGIQRPFKKDDHDQIFEALTLQHTHPDTKATYNPALDLEKVSPPALVALVGMFTNPKELVTKLLKNGAPTEGTIDFDTDDKPKVYQNFAEFFAEQVTQPVTGTRDNTLTIISLITAHQKKMKIKDTLADQIEELLPEGKKDGSAVSIQKGQLATRMRTRR